MLHTVGAVPGAGRLLPWHSGSQEAGELPGAAGAQQTKQALYQGGSLAGQDLPPPRGCLLGAVPLGPGRRPELVPCLARPAGPHSCHLSPSDCFPPHPLPLACADILEKGAPAPRSRFARAPPPPPPVAVHVFHGLCSWSEGQLEGEGAALKSPTPPLSGRGEPDRAGGTGAPDGGCGGGGG